MASRQDAFDIDQLHLPQLLEPHYIKHTITPKDVSKGDRPIPGPVKQGQRKSGESSFRVRREGYIDFSVWPEPDRFQ